MGSNPIYPSNMKGKQMISKIVDKGTVILTQKEFEELPTLEMHELPNSDMYEAIFQFKFMDMYGKWALVNVVNVKNEDEAERGVNFLTARIEIEK
jgi:hypothetical protein